MCITPPQLDMYSAIDFVVRSTETQTYKEVRVECASCRKEEKRVLCWVCVVFDFAVSVIGGRVG